MGISGRERTRAASGNRIGVANTSPDRHHLRPPSLAASSCSRRAPAGRMMLDALRKLNLSEAQEARLHGYRELPTPRPPEHVGRPIRSGSSHREARQCVGPSGAPDTGSARLAHGRGGLGTRAIRRAGIRS
jgi:hypothetical protein